MLDYDVVIIGGSSAGFNAALLATTYQARVALVVPEQMLTPQKSGDTFLDNYGLGFSLRASKTLRQVGLIAQKVRHTSQFGLYYSSPLETPNLEISIAQNQVIDWVRDTLNHLDTQYSLSELASLGVDVIVGKGHFVPKPHLAFVVNGRHLRSLTYLLTISPDSIIPDIEGLESTGYLTGETYPSLFHQHKPEETAALTATSLPNSWVIIGGDPIGVEIAQTLVRLGKQVTMVVKHSQILAKEDPEAAFLVQAQLEAEGVRILTETQVIQAKKIQDKKWVQAGNHALEVDEILIAAGSQPNFASLNLEAVGVERNQRGLCLNTKQQTTNRRIYACGHGVGGYPFPHVANYEAKIALKNALFLPIHQVHYRGIPWAVFSEPQLARVGLTEEQATSRYGKKISVCRQYFKTLDQAVILGETTGFYKLITHQNGHILGASIVGPQAGELIHTIALAINQGLKVDAIAEMSHIWPTLSEMNGQISAALQQQRLNRNTRFKNFLDNLFHWRRYWLS